MWPTPWRSTACEGASDMTHADLIAHHVQHQAKQHIDWTVQARSEWTHKVTRRTATLPGLTVVRTNSAYPGIEMCDHLYEDEISGKVLVSNYYQITGRPELGTSENLYGVWSRRQQRPFILDAWL